MGRIEALTNPLGGQEPIHFEVADHATTISVEEWLNVTDIGPFAIVDAANALAGPFFGLYSPDMPYTPVELIRFENRAGVAPLGQSLASGHMSLPSNPGNWSVHFAGIGTNVGVVGTNVGVDYRLTTC